MIHPMWSKEKRRRRGSGGGREAPRFGWRVNCAAVSCAKLLKFRETAKDAHVVVDVYWLCNWHEIVQNADVQGVSRRKKFLACSWNETDFAA